MGIIHSWLTPGYGPFLDRNVRICVFPCSRYRILCMGVSKNGGGQNLQKCQLIDLFIPILHENFNGKGKEKILSFLFCLLNLVGELQPEGRRTKCLPLHTYTYRSLVTSQQMISGLVFKMRFHSVKRAGLKNDNYVILKQ